MAFDKIVGVDGTTYQFPTLVRARIADNIEEVGSDENLAVIAALAPALATKSATTHNHTLASLSSNGIDELSDVVIGADGGAGIALADKHTIQYESSTSKWRNKVASGGVTVSASRPLTPISGDAWFDSNDGTLYVYYVDGDTSQWVQVVANSALEGTILARLGSLEGRATALEAVPDYSPNYLINGAFDINQRNFTATGVGGFGFDRWFVGGNGFTHSPQQLTATESTTLGNGAKNFVRIVIAGHSGASDYAQLVQRMEDVRTLAGKTVTLSFWAKVASGTPTVSFEWQQNFGTGGSPTGTVLTYASKVVLSGGTSWTRYSMSVDVPSIAGSTFGTDANSSSLNLAFWLSAGSSFNSRSGSIGVNNNTFDIWGVQLEEGPIATPFRRNANSLQGELAACQRYYFRSALRGVNAPYGAGYTDTSTASNVPIQFPVQMRIIPTSVDFSGLQIVRPGINSYSVSNVVVNPDFASDQVMYVNATHAATGASYVSVILRNAGSTSGYLGLSAEL